MNEGDNLYVNRGTVRCATNKVSFAEKGFLSYLYIYREKWELDDIVDDCFWLASSTDNLHDLIP